MPALAAEYGMGALGWGFRPADEEIVMILPAFRSFMPGRKLFIVRNVAVKFPSIEACHPSSPYFFDWPGHRETASCVSDKNVDWPECFFNPMTHRLDLSKLRNIARYLNGDATFSLDVAVYGG